MRQGTLTPRGGAVKCCCTATGADGVATRNPSFSISERSATGGTLAQWSRCGWTRRLGRRTRRSAGGFGRAASARASDRATATGGRLREERERQGLSLRKRAGRLDISPSALSQIETGRSRPSVSTLYAIVSELGISFDELFAVSPEHGSARAPARHPRIKSGEQQIETGRSRPSVSTLYAIVSELGISFDELFAVSPEH